MDTSALTDRIKAARVSVSDLEKEIAGTSWSNPRREVLRTESLILEGLEEAATLLEIDIIE